MFPYLKQLDEHQLKAATAPLGPLVIMAGAGSGKTTTIAKRIEYLCKEGKVNANEVLAVTHSQKAAGELHQRLMQQKLDISSRTFHSAAHKLLKHFWAHTGLENPLSIMPSKYKGVLSAARFVLKKEPASELVSDLVSEISWARSQMIFPSSYSKTVTNRSLAITSLEMESIYKAYEAFKQKNQKLDFDDLLQMAAELLESNAEVAKIYKDTYSFFVVDEYQDTDPLQQRLLTAFLQERDNLSVVGDVNQSIYCFKGAKSTYLENFTTVYPNSTVVSLTKDYRSTPQVVMMANKLVTPKFYLEGQKSPGPLAQLRQFSTEADENAYIVKEIKKLQQKNIPYNQIAILHRFNAQSVRFETLCSQHKIPYSVFGDEKFFDKVEIKEVLIDFGKKARQKPNDVGLETIYETLLAHGFSPKSPPEGMGLLRQKYEAQNALLSLVEQIEGSSTLSNKYLLLDLQKRAMEAHSMPSFGICISTIHKAKGLEWEAVFIPALVEGVLPSSYAQTSEELKEEKNLLYVAITRAMTHVHATMAHKRANGWKSTATRFWSELAKTDQQITVSQNPKQSSGLHSTNSNKSTAYEKEQSNLPKSILHKSCQNCQRILKYKPQQVKGFCKDCLTDTDKSVLNAIFTWRENKSKNSNTPLFELFTDATAWRILEVWPNDLIDLAKVAGISTIDRSIWGKELLKTILEAKNLEAKN